MLLSGMFMPPSRLPLVKRWLCFKLINEELVGGIPVSVVVCVCGRGGKESECAPISCLETKCHRFRETLRKVQEFSARTVVS